MERAAARCHGRVRAGARVTTLVLMALATLSVCCARATPPTGSAPLHASSRRHSAATPSQPPARAAPTGVGLWGWHEAVVDSNVPQCGNVLSSLLTQAPSSALLTGGSYNLVTNRMFLCTHDANATARRAQLPGFGAALLSQHQVSLNYMFGQSKELTNTAGINKWTTEAIVEYNKAAAAGVTPLPQFQFDVEYAATTTDALRVLKMAASVREQVDAAFPPAAGPDARGSVTAPQLVWIIDFASMLPVPYSTIKCPATGKNELIATCLIDNYVDSLIVMDYRSFAVKECLGNPCDGMVVHAAPFLQAAAAAGKQVSIAAETSCNTGTSYQYKISFCADTINKCCATSNPYQYFLDSLANTSAFLTDLTSVTAAYPCAAAQLPKGAPNDLWTGNVPARSQFVVEDMDALYALALGDSVGKACPDDADWYTCL